MARRFAAAALLSILASTVASCIYVSVPAPSAPPPVVEAMPPLPPGHPAGSYVWKPGYWLWNGFHYVWVPGRYVVR